MDQREVLKYEKTFTNKILIISSIIIFIASLEALLQAKSSELLNAYLKAFPNESPNDYLGLIMVNYFYNIIEVIMITLFTVFGMKRFGITVMYKIVFSVMLILRIVNFVLTFKTNSVFYYILIVLYIILLFIISTSKITKRKVSYGIF